MTARDTIAATLCRVRPSERIESRDYDTVLVRDHSPVVNAILGDLAAAGWVLVPEEPTEDMLDSGACYEDPDGLYAGNPLYDEGDLSRDVYRAMLASRPKGGA